METRKFLNIFVCILILSCSNSNKSNPTKSDSISKESVLFNSIIGDEKDSLKVYFKNDSVFFKYINNNNEILSVPWLKKRNYPSEQLAGIYLIDDKTIKKVSVCKNSNYAYFSIFDELYRGQLYAINFTEKKLVYDGHFNRNYIVSQSGIFIFDKQRNRIMTIDKSHLDDKTNVMVTTIALYSVNDNSFNNLGITNISGELMYSDSLIMQFYKKYEKAKGRWNMLK